ncbi:plasmid pRiA4b ORF-3 family protein [Cupriavidus pinatubonensis]|uniref:plasmid pRiA4b ORF-3 family protein n=1 Tax=Cupriavidus pinatubonensis TaxID=248026 RepID=UPI00112B5896|nr:plasmid pRiA4b ORF-3 family protein [Cupriavidus pinatubonensis]TPQ32034.1 hypothetical protein C2U69_27490 [Cupriavidus pinatubonensis]
MASDPGPATSALQLRIALRGLSPSVWRRVLVPEHLTLGQLHNVIQVVMGWADEHLHTFSIRGRRYGEEHEACDQDTPLCAAEHNCESRASLELGWSDAAAGQVRWILAADAGQANSPGGGKLRRRPRHHTRSSARRAA